MTTADSVGKYHNYIITVPVAVFAGTARSELSAGRLSRSSPETHMSIC